MRNSVGYLLLSLSCVLAGGYVHAQTASSAAPDNSRSNRTDSSNSASTADAQSNSAVDVDLTKRIRQSLMADKALSTYGHNIKIVSIGGNVTLNGVVRTEEEKSSVAAKAEDVAGKGHVTNALKVAPGNQ